MKVWFKTLSIHEMYYCVEMEGDDIPSQDFLQSELNCGNIEEVGQKHLGEMIQDGSLEEVNDLIYLEKFDRINDYLKSWNDEEKLRYIRRYVE